MKNPLRKLRNWLRSLVVSKDSLKRICVILEKFKNGLDSGLAIWAVELTKPEWDNKLRDRLVRHLKQAIKAIKIFDSDSNTIILTRAQIVLEGMSKEERNKVWEALGGKMLNYQSGMSTDVAELVVKEYYDANKAEVVLEAGV